MIHGPPVGFGGAICPGALITTATEKAVSDYVRLDWDVIHRRTRSLVQGRGALIGWNQLNLC